MSVALGLSVGPCTGRSDDVIREIESNCLLVKNLTGGWGSGGRQDADAISGSCRAGYGYSERVSTVSPLLSIMGLLATTTSRPDEEPATGAISTSGRATSGSGLGAPPRYGELRATST